MAFLKQNSTSEPKYFDHPLIHHLCCKFTKPVCVYSVYVQCTTKNPSGFHTIMNTENWFKPITPRSFEYSFIQNENRCNGIILDLKLWHAPLVTNHTSSKSSFSSNFFSKHLQKTITEFIFDDFAKTFKNFENGKFKCSLRITPPSCGATPGLHLTLT